MERFFFVLKDRKSKYQISQNNKLLNVMQDNLEQLHLRVVWDHHQTKMKFETNL